MNTVYNLNIGKMLQFMATPVVFSGGVQPSFGLPIRSTLPCHPLISSTPSSNPKRILCLKAKRKSRTIKNLEESTDNPVYILKDRHIGWCVENILSCEKKSSKELTSRLDYSNLLGLGCNLTDESTNEGKHFIKLLELKSKFPKEIFLWRVGDSYEAIGFDACMLVEYTDLNPMQHSNSSFPKVVFHFENLYQALDGLISKGFTVCIVEELPRPYGHHFSLCIDGLRRERWSNEKYVHMSHVKPGGYRFSSNDDNPTDEGMEEFREHLKKLVYEICLKELNRLLDGLSHTSEKSGDEEYLPICDSISPDCKPPFKTAGRSYTYLMIRPNKEIFLGETDNLYAWIYIHRLEKGMKNCWFLYFLTPDAELARLMKILLISQLSRAGVTCTNWRD